MKMEIKETIQKNEKEIIKDFLIVTFVVSLALAVMVVELVVQ